MVEFNISLVGLTISLLCVIIVIYGMRQLWKIIKRTNWFIEFDIKQQMEQKKKIKKSKIEDVTNQLKLLGVLCDHINNKILKTTKQRNQFYLDFGLRSGAREYWINYIIEKIKENETKKTNIDQIGEGVGYNPLPKEKGSKPNPTPPPSKKK